MNLEHTWLYITQNRNQVPEKINGSVKQRKKNQKLVTTRTGKRRKHLKACLQLKRSSI